MSVWHRNLAFYATGSIVLGPKNVPTPLFTTGSLAVWLEDRTGQLVRRRGYPDHDVWLVRESVGDSHVVVNQFEEKKTIGELAFLRGEWEKVAG